MLRYIIGGVALGAIGMGWKSILIILRLMHYTMNTNHMSIMK